MSRRAASAETVATRTAVTAALRDLGAGSTVIVACSGGADSLSLTAATAWAAPRLDMRAEAVVVDHGLQGDSGAVARAAAHACAALGLPARVVRVSVGTAGGPEAAARDARRVALMAAAAEAGAAAILLGHTQDDQAETVLLRLARGSGARSLAAMSSQSDQWRRPFLHLSRAVVRTAAAEALDPLGLVAWEDPHNADPAFARARVRGLMAGLQAELGAGVVRGLARSADLLRDDADALDALADDAYAALVTSDGDGVAAGTDALAALPAAIRSRIIRRMALACGSPGEDLGIEQVRRIDALVIDWRGQGEVQLPGGATASRAYGRLSLRPA